MFFRTSKGKLKIRHMSWKTRMLEYSTQMAQFYPLDIGNEQHNLRISIYKNASPNFHMRVQRSGKFRETQQLSQVSSVNEQRLSTNRGNVPNEWQLSRTLNTAFLHIYEALKALFKSVLMILLETKLSSNCLFFCSMATVERTLLFLFWRMGIYLWKY